MGTVGGSPGLGGDCLMPQQSLWSCNSARDERPAPGKNGWRLRTRINKCIRGAWAQDAQEATRLGASGAPGAMATHSFETGFSFDVGDSDNDEEGFEDMSAEEAQLELADKLVDLKMKGKLSAKDVCVIAYFATKAGLPKGPLADLAYNPAAQSGHFNRHLSRVLKLDSELMKGAYLLEVPGHDKFALSRTQAKLPVLPPHECLEKSISQGGSLSAQRLRVSVREKDWASQYYAHPVVQGAAPEEAVWPLALYVDGVPFQKRDGLIAFYAYDLVTNTRHLCTVLRKSELCKCGCLGWCSLWPVLAFLEWSFAALATGTKPTRRHDGRPFGDGDQTRSEQAGQVMLKGAVVHVKGDWAEIAQTFAMPMWNHNTNPCFKCCATKEDLRSLGALSPMSDPFRKKTAEMYEEACKACERKVEVKNRHIHGRLLGLLVYDRRPNGRRGRVLSEDFQSLGLKAGDRLEPTHQLPDVAAFDQVAEFPATFTFWRVGNESLTRHRNPLFNGGARITPEHLAVDALHTLNLGVYKEFCTTALWELILNDAWGTGDKNKAVLVESSVRHCRSELFAWYKKQKQDRPTEILYELQNLTEKMLGNPTQRTLATKAAETGTLLEFCTDMVEQYSAKLGAGAKPLLEMGKALVRMRALMRTQPRVMPPTVVQEFVDLGKRVFSLREFAGVPFRPKFHLMLHMCADARFAGNPHYYHTFLDEDYNGRLAKLAATCHRLTWHKNVLANFRYAFSSGSKRRR